jgi:hypothetical protein
MNSTEQEAKQEATSMLQRAGPQGKFKEKKK